MASSSPHDSLLRTQELGRYEEGLEAGSGRPQENTRFMAAEEIGLVKKCAGCGKHMAKVKSKLLCSCKLAFHCSKDCQKSSNHKCYEPVPQTTFSDAPCFDRMRSSATQANKKTWKR